MQHVRPRRCMYSVGRPFRMFVVIEHGSTELFAACQHNLSSTQPLGSHAVFVCDDVARSWDSSSLFRSRCGLSYVRSRPIGPNLLLRRGAVASWGAHRLGSQSLMGALPDSTPSSFMDRLPVNSLSDACKACAAR